MQLYVPGDVVVVGGGVDVMWVGNGDFVDVMWVGDADWVGSGVVVMWVGDDDADGVAGGVDVMCVGDGIGELPPLLHLCSGVWNEEVKVEIQ